MTKQTLIKDINNIEDILEQTVNNNGLIYWLAVAVWHLLMDKARGMTNNETRRHQ